MIPPFTDPNGTVYSFDHLNPIHAAVSVTVNGKRYRIPVVVIFSNHCYTDGKRGTVRRDDPLYLTNDRTGNRAFCAVRWQRSLGLPALVAAMIEASLNCYKLDAADGYMHIPDPASPNKWIGWYVCFRFDKSKAGEPVALRISVTSYHHRTTKPENLRWTGTIKFPALVVEWLRKREDFLHLFAPIEEEGVSALAAEATDQATRPDAPKVAAEMEKPA
jgi:hypothetical protein